MVIFLCTGAIASSNVRDLLQLLHFDNESTAKKFNYLFSRSNENGFKSRRKKLCQSAWPFYSATDNVDKGNTNISFQGLFSSEKTGLIKGRPIFSKESPKGSYFSFFFNLVPIHSLPHASTIQVHIYLVWITVIVFGAYMTNSDRLRNHPARSVYIPSMASLLINFPLISNQNFGLFPRQIAEKSKAFWFLVVALHYSCFVIFFCHI